MNFTCHETAIIDPGAQIGKDTRIWHWVHICAGAKIGERCSFGQNVFVGNKVTIGNNVKVQNNVSIYDNIQIDDDVFCGPSMVFTNVINPRSEFIRKEEYKLTYVERGSTIGANATVVCGVRLGSYCFVAAGSVITKDVKPFALVAGVPAKQIGWMSRFGSRIDLPLSGEGQWDCPDTGDRYTLRGDMLQVQKRT